MPITKLSLIFCEFFGKLYMKAFTVQYCNLFLEYSRVVDGGGGGVAGRAKVHVLKRHVCSKLNLIAKYNNFNL